MVQKEWLHIKTPNGEIWSDQAHMIRRDLVGGLRLCKKMTSLGSPENYSASNTIWVRCPDFPSAQSLYDRLVGQLSGSDDEGRIASDRAGRVSPRAGSRLGHSATIPCA